jgi:hypothetical protein
VSGWAFMILPLSLAALSYIFYHKKLKANSSNEILDGSLAFK